MLHAVLHKNNDLLSLGGWTECLSQFDNDTANLQPTATVYSGSHEEEALSFPEAFDPKTDTGCFEVLPVSILLKKGIVARGSQLSVAEVHGTLDLFIAMQAMFLRCQQQPFHACTFMLDRSLADDHPVLKLCTQSMCRVLISTNRYIFDSSVRDGEEEYSSGLLEWYRFLDDLPQTNEIVSAINDLISAGTSGSVTQVMLDHLAYHRDCLRILFPLHTFGEEDAAKGLATVTNSLKKLDRADDEHFDSSKPPQNIARVFYGPGMMMTKPVELIPMRDAFTVIAQLYVDLGEVCQWRHLSNIYEVMEAVKQFGSRKPCLLARALAQLYTLDERQTVVCSERPMTQWIIDALDKVHGAPVYSAVFHNKQPILGEVVDFRASLLGPRGEKMKAIIEQETVRQMHSWAQDASTCVMLWLRAHLRTRGRLHRGMMNLIHQIGALQRQSQDLDTQTFTRPGPLPSTASSSVREAVMHSAVLTAFSNHLMCETMLEMFGQVIALDLLSKPEMPTVMFYHGTVANFRYENLASLFPTSSMMVDRSQAVSRKGPPLFGPAIYTRVPRSSTSIVGSTAELLRQAAHGSLLLLSVVQGRIPDLEPSNWLQSLDTIIEGRFFCMLHSRGPTAIPYRDIKRQIDTMGANPIQACTQAAELFQIILGTIKALRANKGRELEEDYANSPSAEKLVNAIERSAKESSLVAAMLKRDFDKGKVAGKTPKEMLSAYRFEITHTLHPNVTSFKFSLVQ